MVRDEAPSTLQCFASPIIHCPKHPVKVLAVLDAQILRHLLREGMLAVGRGHMRGRVAKVQKRPQLETGVGPQRVEGPRTIRELVALTLRQSLDFFAAILIPLLNAREIRVSTIAARQVLLVECRVLADQVAICLVDVGERP